MLLDTFKIEHFPGATLNFKPSLSSKYLYVYVTYSEERAKQAAFELQDAVQIYSIENPGDE